MLDSMFHIQSIKCLSVLSICVLQNDLDSEILLPAMHNKNVKGVLHPRPVFRLFLHFSQKLQHIGNK